MAPNNQKADFEHLIATLPGSVSELARAAVALAEGGEELQAESILRIAVRKVTASELRVALAHVLIRQNRHKEAMGEMVGVLRADSENPAALLVLAMCLMECGELDRGGKMLQKARLSGANRDEAQRLELRWHELVEQSTDPAALDLTLPDIGGSAGSAPSPNAPEESSDEFARRRHETLMGRPATDRLEHPPIFAVGDPAGNTAPKPPGPPAKSRRVPPPPIQSGTFESLNTWDLDDASENDLDTTAIAPETVRLSDAGPLERVLPPAPREYAKPDDMTSALLLDEEDLAAPDEPTGHIPYSEVERGIRAAEQHFQPTVERDIDKMPSVEYDARFAAEAREVRKQERPPPADLDDLPAYASDVRGYDAPVGDHWGDYSAPVPDEMPERPGASMLDYGDWNDIPAMPNSPSAPQYPAAPVYSPPPQAPARHDFAAAPPQQQQQFAPAAPVAPNEQSFQLQGNDARSATPDRMGEPMSPRRREDTAVAGSPRAPAAASASLRVLIEKRWPLVLVIVLASVMSLFLLVTVGSGWSLTSNLKAGLQAASSARDADTFAGFVASEKQLLDVSNTHSFMSSGFDRFVETTMPIPGLSGANLRRRAIADLAAMSAIIEFRFEKVGDRTAATRLAQAQDLAPKEPGTAIADAYVALAANEPARAITVLEAARATHAGDARLAEALAWAQLSLGRVADAARTVQDFRDAPAPSVHQRYLLASVDAARGDAAAADAFARVFADSPDHADARIGRSYALLAGEKKGVDDATRALDAVLTKLAESTSTFQKARATSAYGSVHLATGQTDAAEERFRSAVAKMPSRGELYPALLSFLEGAGKKDEIDALLEKAKSNKAYTPQLALYEAELRLMASRPEDAVKILDGLGFEDSRKSFLQGFALLDQYRPAAARDLLEKAQTAPGDALEAQALRYVARTLASSEAVEDAKAALDRIKSKHADNAVVHWAAAIVGLTGAEITPNQSTRTELLKGAAEDSARAYELRPDWPPIQFLRCDIYLRDLESEKAEKACFAGRKLAPDYAPGLVTTARLRLMEGKFDDAKELADRALKLRPNDPVVGLLAARVAIERQELPRASELINRWLGKSVDKYEHSLLEGRLEFARENYTRAAGYLKEAFEMRPNEGEATIYYGHTLARLGDYGNASTLLRKYLDHPTWSGYAWAVLGEVRRKQRKLKDAYENLDKAIKIYSAQSVPSRYWSHVYTEYALANQIKYRKWRHPQVKRMLDRGRKKGDPNDPGLNMAYGQYYLNLRRPDYVQAMKSIQKVVDAAPHRCDAVDALRNLYRRAKRDDVSTLDDVYAKHCTDEKPQP